MIEALKLALVIEEFDKNDESIPMELLKPIAATLRAIAELESQEPVCPECKAEVLYECVACSRNNYPPQRTEQEPVAWGVFEGNLHDMFFSQAEAEHMALLKGSHAEVRPLYTHPPQRTWVGSSDLEDSNAYLDPPVQFKCTVVDDQHPQGIPLEQWGTAAQRKQEPPPWWPAVENILKEYGLQAIDFVADFKKGLAAPAQPAQRTWVGLTPEEILDVFDAENVYGSKWLEFSRAVENKLKEKNT
jgi:hypothetical protein